MRKIVIAVLLIVIILVAGIYSYKRSVTSQIVPQPSLIPSVQVSRNPVSDIPISSTPGVYPGLNTYCSPKDLQSLLSLSAGAGNIYGTFTMKNISGKNCQIPGNNFITATYDTQTIKNISITHVGKPEAQTFLLVPNQTIYSQVHYPNGPQCNGGIQTAKVLFTYAISPANIITFSNQNGEKEQSIAACATADFTTIEIWNMSAQPITP